MLDFILVLYLCFLGLVWKRGKSSPKPSLRYLLYLIFMNIKGFLYLGDMFFFIFVTFQMSNPNLNVVFKSVANYNGPLYSLFIFSFMYLVNFFIRVRLLFMTVTSMSGSTTKDKGSLSFLFCPNTRSNSHQTLWLLDPCLKIIIVHGNELSLF